ncbi:hypothetical protein CWO89_01230 [Bradyrhizobium sp. Leo170]|nr:hypothetical protein CWO89_01230 [Bradyrhizobium sp. Leo170]
MPGLARLRYRFAGLRLECPAKPRRSRVPGIHVLRARDNVDGRVKPGHDGGEDCATRRSVIPGRCASIEPGIHFSTCACGPMDSGLALRAPRNDDGGCCKLAQCAPHAAGSSGSSAAWKRVDASLASPDAPNTAAAVMSLARWVHSSQTRLSISGGSSRACCMFLQRASAPSMPHHC